MKIMKYGFIAVLIVALALLFLNGSIPVRYLKAVDRSGNFSGPNAPAVMDAHSEWKTFVQDAEQAIDANEKRIAAFRETIEEAGPKAILEFRRTVDVLDQKNGELKRQLRSYTDQRRSEQEQFRSAFRSRLDSVGQRLQSVLKDNG